MTNPEFIVVRKRGNKYRLVDKRTSRLIRFSDGKPVDGGGYKTKDKASKQRIAIFESFGRKRRRRY